MKNLSTYPYPYSKAPQLDKRITIPRPPVDPSLAPLVDSFLLPEYLDIAFMRGVGGGGDGNTDASDKEKPTDETSTTDMASVYNADTVLAKGPHLKHTEYSVPGPDGNSVILSVFAPKTPSSARLPALFHIHGGGMVSGDRFTAVPELLDLLAGVECVVVSVEYRLAPETRAPGAAEDCYAGYEWVTGHGSELGIDPRRVVVWGVSGGGTLAAVLSLMVRDRTEAEASITAESTTQSTTDIQSPSNPTTTPTLSTPLGLMLVAPMLDDRCDSLSDTQFRYGSPWPGTANPMAWDCVLGPGLRASDKVTPYQAPSRAADLSRLPPTYIDVGECEVFRDPAVQYATTLWRCGSTCELHVWPGAVHMFDGMDNPENALVHGAIVAKQTWLKRVMLQ